MMTGEVNYNDLLYRTQWLVKNSTLDTTTIPSIFPYTGNAILLIFICVIPIIIMNLFFGIAVSDVDYIIKLSAIRQKINLVKIIWQYEKTLTLLISITPSFMHQFIKPPLFSKDMKEVGKNICEVELDGYGREKFISRRLNHELKDAIKRFS